jgi:hypothetical protein
VIDQKGALVGTTPWEHSRTTADGTETYTLRVPGYIDKVLQLRRDADEMRRETLQPDGKPSTQRPIPDPPPGTKKPTPPSRPKKDLYID